MNNQTPVTVDDVLRIAEALDHQADRERLSRSLESDPHEYAALTTKIEVYEKIVETIRGLFK